MALGIALAVSLVVNVALVRALLRRRRRFSRGQVGTPKPKAFEDERDLGTLLLTSQDFEIWWNNMLSVARARVGPDLRAYVEAIHIWPSPFIVFYGESAIALKGFGGTVGGPHPDHVSFYGVYKKDALWVGPVDEPLWRRDDSWRELVRVSWLRERPVESSCVLYPRRGSDRWEASYSAYQTEDERRVEARTYWFEDGQLKVGPSGRVR